MAIREIAKEVDELRVVQHWINQEGWDVASEVCVTSPNTGKSVDLRLDWGEVQRKLSEGLGDAAEADIGSLDDTAQLVDYSLEKLDPTQRAFADRVLKWAHSAVWAVTDCAADCGVHCVGPARRIAGLRIVIQVVSL